MRNSGGLMHCFIRRQQVLAAAPVADEQFSVNEFVAGHFVALKQTVQFGGVWRAIGQESNPDGCIHKHHQAVPRRRGNVLSRCRRTSRARGSDPRRVRRRWQAAWRTSASRPSLTVSVSVVAPHACLAASNSFSSILNVFFIWLFIPYKYGIRC